MELNLDAISRFQGQSLPRDTSLIGWAALVAGMGLQAPVRQPCCVSKKHVRGSQRASGGWRIFDKRYAPGRQLTDHLAFALRHEPIDLLILKRTFDNISTDALEQFVKSAPTGTQTRRAWFFYELLTGRRLALEDAPTATAIDALSEDDYFTGKARLSRRHRVRDNLLGTGDYCPVIRKTATLNAAIARDLEVQAADTVGRTSRRHLLRAASFLLLADSKASFEIEGERAPRSRLERWGKAVINAGRAALTLAEIENLHRELIADTRFIFPGLRPDGVFLGERDMAGDPLPEFIGARPDDLQSLCEALLTVNERMRDDGVDPVLQAAATAFGFVYIHPFQDGNGRIHRCLIHHVLAERNYTPPGVVFPVSSVMLDEIDAYQRSLQAHSTPLMDFIEWRPTGEQNVAVTNDTADLYRYFDCTGAAEFLYTCVQRAVEQDLPAEIAYIAAHDEAMSRLMERVEMPDQLAQQLILFVRQNHNRLSERKRARYFGALTDAEVQELEQIIEEAFADLDTSFQPG